MNIVLIGTGNTATILGRKFTKAGHRIVQVFGRNEMEAKTLAFTLGAAFTAEANVIARNAELYLLAVSDKAVEEVAGLLPLADKTVVHTAASVPVNVLKGKAKQYGVFYPLQSMRKELHQLPEIPLLVDASDAETLHLLKELAASISGNVMVADDMMRVKLHLAAVMVNNFTNYLFTLVENYCRSENLDFSLLLPLLQETILRLKEIPPSQAQTGPAVRNDTVTIAKHLSLLEKAPELRKVYALFTESIRQSRR